MAEETIIEEKPKRGRPKKIKQKEKFSLLLEDGSEIDLDSYDWGEKALSSKEKLFIFWFTYPETRAHHDAAKAARKAGYSLKTAAQQGHNIKNRDYIAPIIQKFDDMYTKTTIEDVYKRIVRRKAIRAEYDGTDFYKFETVTTEDGNSYLKVTPKKPEELTEEQRMCIDGVDFVGQRSIPNYKLPDRKAEENKIIELYEKQTGQDNSDNYQVETTAEIIKGNLQVKTKVMRKNAEITELSDLKNKASDNRAEED